MISSHLSGVIIVGIVFFTGLIIAVASILSDHKLKAEKIKADAMVKAEEIKAKNQLEIEKLILQDQNKINIQNIKKEDSVLEDTNKAKNKLSN
ncbi:UNVERIFIED_CONTAM: hypothetical protein Cloal_1386 [Acetivibrio alkalicellulosi]